MESRIKYLSDTEHLKDFPGYAVDTEGNVWSFKHNKMRKLSPGLKKKGYGYRTVLLSDKSGNKKNFLVHRLVALCFIPTQDTSLQVNHINRNSCDNRVENLEWVTHQENSDHANNTNGFKLDAFVTTKVKEVHSASIRKGLPVPDSHSFINSLLEGALEEYISQYGLRKLMNTISN